MFFFQAEDGIRDKLVTGVQTCALPISREERRSEHLCSSLERAIELQEQGRGVETPKPRSDREWERRRARRQQIRFRSEERRVGKSVDLGGRRIIKKKKKITGRREP